MFTYRCLHVKYTVHCGPVCGSQQRIKPLNLLPERFVIHAARSWRRRLRLLVREKDGFAGRRRSVLPFHHILDNSTTLSLKISQFHSSHNENAVILITEPDLALNVISCVLVT